MQVCLAVQSRAVHAVIYAREQGISAVDGDTASPAPATGSFHSIFLSVLPKAATTSLAHLRAVMVRSLADPVGLVPSCVALCDLYPSSLIWPYETPCASLYTLVQGPPLLIGQVPTSQVPRACVCLFLNPKLISSFGWGPSKHPSTLDSNPSINLQISMKRKQTI
jgi:hypothetical protein